MKKHILPILLLASVLISCGKEDSLEPSLGDRNWLIINDVPDSPLDHLRYEVYKSTNIPIYYNDTIGTEKRKDVFGGISNYYETLQTFYCPGQINPVQINANFKLVKDPNSLIPAINYFRDEIIPVIPESIYVPSIFLVDSLVSPSGPVAHKGLNTLVVAGANRLGSMTDNEKRAFKGGVLRGLIGAEVFSKQQPWLEKNFYKLTYQVNSLIVPEKYYSASRYTYIYQLYVGIVPKVLDPDMQISYFGFITTGRKPYEGQQESDMTAPTKMQDVNSYIEAVLAYSIADLDAKYAGKAVILAKMAAMRELLHLQYGFNFN